MRIINPLEGKTTLEYDRHGNLLIKKQINSPTKMQDMVSDMRNDNWYWNKSRLNVQEINDFILLLILQ